MRRVFSRLQLRHRLNVSRQAIRFPWLTIGFWIAVTVAGCLALSSLRYALFPDITFPVVVVTANGPTETALASEAELAAPIEAELATLEDVKESRTLIYPGRTVTNLSFRVGTDLAASAAAVETALAAADLPDAVSYRVLSLNLNESAVVSYALTPQEATLSDLGDRAEAEILPAIADIPGVLRVDLLGLATPDPPPDADTLAAPPTLTRLNGEETLALRVIKAADANTLEVVDQVEAAMAQVRNDLPDIAITLAATQADYIQEAVQSTIDALVLAIVIAVLVIFLFLRNWRATLITALAIPISLLGTAIIMASYGFNLETITLLALALVIGIIVDDAIVEVENIVRHIEEGNPPRVAALMATQEIGLTVSASTLTIVAVFLPVALMEDTVGQFFKPFGLTVSAAVLISLLIARTLSPVLAVYWLRRPTQQAAQAAGTPAAAEPVTESIIIRVYRRLLAWSLRHRLRVVGMAVLSFVAGGLLIPLIPQGFIPELDRGEFNVVFTAPPQVSLAAGQNRPDNIPSAATAQGDRPNPLAAILNQTQTVAADLEATTLANDQVEAVFTTIGDRGEPNRGILYVKLRDDRTLTTAEVQAQLRADLAVPAGGSLSVEPIQFVDTGGEKPLQVALLGQDLAVLNQSAQAIRDRLVEVPGFVDVAITNGKAEGRDEAIPQIEHRDGQRAVSISANLGPNTALGEATDQMVAIAESSLPPDITLSLGGDSARANTVLGSFARTLALSVICMLLLLMLPFGRLLEPLVVGLSLPLALVGAMLALLITQSDFGMISLIGLLFLLGLLDKNALLLLDYINQLRKTGLDRTEAILKTGVVRLRPILMTTASTIFGMLPIALGWGAGAELRQPMAVAIIGGLFTSALLSLIVVPVLYTLLEDAWQKLMKRIA